MILQVIGNNLLDLYIEANAAMFFQQGPFVYRGYQKIHQALVLSANRVGSFPITLEDMGYTATKLNNLIKHYSSANELAKWPRKLETSRQADQASIYYTTVGEDKGDHKKDHCIRGIGVNFSKGVMTNVHVFYRSSELSRKFLADLIFFTSYLFPKLEIPKSIPIHLHFTCAYVHSKQFPMYLCIMARDVMEFEFPDNIPDSKYMNMVLNNIDAIVSSPKEGYGLVKATNRVFRLEHSSNPIVASMIKDLKKVVYK